MALDSGSASFRMLELPRKFPADWPKRFAQHAAGSLDSVTDAESTGWVTGRHLLDSHITAGTAIRESMELLKNLDTGTVEAIIIAVDRMEKGKGEESALKELEQEFGVKVYPIVTIREMISYLHNREIGGKVYVDDALYARVLEYQKIYGVNSCD